MVQTVYLSLKNLFLIKVVLAIPYGTPVSLSRPNDSALWVAAKCNNCYYCFYQYWLKFLIAIICKKMFEYTWLCSFATLCSIFCISIFHVLMRESKLIDWGTLEPGGELLFGDLSLLNIRAVIRQSLRSQLCLLVHLFIPCF